MALRNQSCFIFIPQVDAADPAFPRSTAYWWFGCKSANRGTLGNDNWPFASISKVDVVDDDTYDFGSVDSIDDIILDAGTRSFNQILPSLQATPWYPSYAMIPSSILRQIPRRLLLDLRIRFNNNEFPFSAANTPPLI